MFNSINHVIVNWFDFDMCYGSVIVRLGMEKGNAVEAVKERVLALHMGDFDMLCCRFDFVISNF